MKHIGELIGNVTRGNPGKQKQLAKLCGVTPQAITGWIKTGKVAKIHFKNIAAFCNVPIKTLHDIEAQNTSETSPDAADKAKRKELPYEDQDIHELAEMWPQMPENVKNSIRLIVRDWLESIEPQIKNYLANTSRPGQKKFNAHMEKNVPKPGQDSTNKAGKTHKP